MTGDNAARNLAALRRISSLIHQPSRLREILESVIDELLGLSGMDAGILSLVPSAEASEPIAARRAFSAGLAQEIEAELRKDPELYQLQVRRTLLDDASKSPNGNLVQALRGESFRLFVLYPVRCADRTIGVVGLASHRSRAVTEHQEDLIQTALVLLGAAVSNLRLLEQSSKLSEDLVALQEMNKIISQSLNPDQIIQRIVTEGKRLVKTSECHLFLVDERSQSLAGAATTQPDLNIRALEIKFSETALSVLALAEKRIIAVEDVAGHERTNRRLLASMKWRSAIFAPLLTKNQPIGILILSESARPRAFRHDEIARAEALAHQAAIALENARLFQAVSRSQREWETTFDAMQDCVSVHDTTGRVIRANMALARRLKTTPHKVVGKSCSEIYNSDGLSLIPCRHTPSLQSGTPTVEELELPSMGGAFQISVSPWYDKNNRLAGSIHVAKDISHEKLLQQQLIQSEKLSAIGELISGIAHELNNPLTGVMGYSQLLQVRKDLDERAKDSLLKINNLALRCQKIVQNLLSFARKQKPERVVSDINEILERTIDLRSYELQVNNIEIERDLDRRLPKTIADAHQLQQVFLNLITNAEQAMLEAHGRGRLVVRTRASHESRRIIIEIVDDGPGIHEAHLSKIFDPFFTTKDVGKGTGLGLSLSYGIIKEHDGNIYVRSRIGEGASFVVELPIIAAFQDQLKISTQKTARDQKFEDVVRDRKILVVDDEQYILDFFIEVFKMFPMRVDTAGNGRAAIERIQVTSYDLIITDFKMPQMSGRELFDWISQEQPHLTRRIVFVTGDTVSSETRTFFEESNSRYLAKPFKIEEVKEVISQALEEASVQQT